MTANEFIELYAKLAVPVEAFLHEKNGDILKKIYYDPYFCKKREIPLLLPYTYDDVILDIIKNYEVDNGTFTFFQGLRFHYKYNVDYLDRLFLEYNAIIIGSHTSDTLVINIEDGVVEYRNSETPEAESVFKGHGFRCALDGEHFLEAGLWYEKNITPINLAKSREDRMNPSEEEVEEIRRIAAQCTEIAGGKQFTDYWYSYVCELY